MPRRARIDFPGALHHIGIRGINKAEIFYDRRDRMNFLARLGLRALATKTECFAWALMSNHAHFLLRSGPGSLPSFMQSLLTSYARYFNRRHQRVGYLFQNRYKSIICQEKRYFLELVRYIHLNPLRAGLVPGIDSLIDYPWCGHGVIMGKRAIQWQNVRTVLDLFGSNDERSRQSYMSFIRSGVAQGHREDLSGGGLIRSSGGWQKLREMRKRGIRQRGDERILGSGSFVEEILGAIGENLAPKERSLAAKQTLAGLLGRVAAEIGVDPKDVIIRKKTPACCAARARVAFIATREWGYSLTEVAAFLGVDRAAVFRAIEKMDGEAAAE